MSILSQTPRAREGIEHMTTPHTKKPKNIWKTNLPEQLHPRANSHSSAVFDALA
ncbi:hypothetical protein Thiosp_04120 [Thiorhodovibrio litoralis]|nr:hypothetical protein Thiosp_04120 [Thiorhodovibrio litoralis]